MQDEKVVKVADILAEIRNVASPGRSGKAYPYAQTIYACFSEIEKLIDAGFTMATICKYLEGEGVLPNGADIHSFRRAFRREVARRSRQSTRSGIKEKNDTSKKVHSNEGVRDMSALKSPLASEREMSRSGRVVKTGMTKILKKSDGSFEVLEDRFAEI